MLSVSTAPLIEATRAHGAYPYSTAKTSASINTEPDLSPSVIPITCPRTADIPRPPSMSGSTACVISIMSPRWTESMSSFVTGRRTRYVGSEKRRSGRIAMSRA